MLKRRLELARRERMCWRRRAAPVVERFQSPSLGLWPRLRALGMIAKATLLLGIDWRGKTHPELAHRCTFAGVSLHRCRASDPEQV